MPAAQFSLAIHFAAPILEVNGIRGSEDASDAPRGSLSALSISAYQEVFR